MGQHTIWKWQCESIKTKEWEVVAAIDFALVRMAEHALNNICTVEPMTTMTSTQGLFLWPFSHLNIISFAYIACRTWLNTRTHTYKFTYTYRTLNGGGQSEKQSFNLWHFVKQKNIEERKRNKEQRQQQENVTAGCL